MTGKRKGWGTHRWSGWPGSYCMLCSISDVAETAIDSFPLPLELNNPTALEDQAMKAWWDMIDKKQGDCPRNPDGSDPYEIEPRP